MRVALLIPLAAGLGCAAPPMGGDLVWHADLAAALREARRQEKPLFVLSLVGDLKKRCWLAAYAFRAKTLSQPDVADFLRSRFVLAQHNQLPRLYCNDAVDPGRDRYPGDMVDTCPEGAGGGNVRSYLCSSGGEIRSLILGYWKPERFLEELRHAIDLADKEHLRQHVFLRDRETQPLEIARQNLLIRGHEEILNDFGRPVGKVLTRLEDEIYTKGRIGWD